MSNNNNNGHAANPQPMSKRAAISEATTRVGPLFEIAKGRWSYHVWSPTDEGWIPALRADGYGEARRKRTSTIAAMATDLLVRDGGLSKRSSRCRSSVSPTAQTILDR